MKKGLIILLVILVIGAAGVFTLIHFIKKKLEAEKQVTAALPQKLLDIISDKKTIDRLPLDSTVKLEFQRYLYLEEGFTEIDGKAIYFKYRSWTNELLGTDMYSDGKDLDGVIIGSNYFEIVGYYGTEIPQNKAVKYACVLNYMKFPEIVVVHRDTVWGTDPPPIAYRHRTSGAGEHPKVSEVVEAIQKVLGEKNNTLLILKQKK